MYVLFKVVVMSSRFNDLSLIDSWVATVGIRATVYLHEILLDTHAQPPNLTANVIIYVLFIMFMCFS